MWHVMPALKVGDALRVLHTDGQVYAAKVVETKPKQIKVHYMGWKKTWDEWLPRSSQRVLKPTEGTSSGETSQEQEQLDEGEEGEEEEKQRHQQQENDYNKGLAFKRPHGRTHGTVRDDNNGSGHTHQVQACPDSPSHAPAGHFCATLLYASSLFVLMQRIEQNIHPRGIFKTFIKQKFQSRRAA